MGILTHISYDCYLYECPLFHWCIDIDGYIYILK